MIFKVEGFSGINNVDELYRRNKIEFGADGNAMLSGDLKSCINFRIKKDGLATVRNGQTDKGATGSHSLWCNKAGGLCFFVSGNSLKLLNSDFTATTLSTVTAGRRMNYIEHNNIIFMGNGAEMLKYKDGVLSTWGDISITDGGLEVPTRTYRTPSLSNVLLSYRARTYIAEGRFAFYSEPLLPETFRRVNFLTAPDDITAMSYDANGIYLHTLNTTTGFMGQDPEDFTQVETVNIGAVKHGAIMAGDFNTPIVLSKKGWAYCEGGGIKYLDHENFRLDLPATAEAYLSYDTVNKEVIGAISV